MAALVCAASLSQPDSHALTLPAGQRNSLGYTVSSSQGKPDTVVLSAQDDSRHTPVSMSAEVNQGHTVPSYQVEPSTMALSAQDDPSHTPLSVSPVSQGHEALSSQVMTDPVPHASHVDVGSQGSPPDEGSARDPNTPSAPQPVSQRLGADNHSTTDGSKAISVKPQLETAPMSCGVQGTAQPTAVELAFAAAVAASNLTLRHWRQSRVRLWESLHKLSLPAVSDFPSQF
ncbi:hypothetical protein B0T26DRAFT_680840 [Lasiosphaeria miniovina]|uniref:Uncharacterized protein n=1 Tax=Lasiosphaeria miniovina TaxID=1954250 RepID=A0AA40DKF4_9PEZI|nr:uncharacterized protein B0T26DRAFT_680840 [Lasiosphaeria miniovina]KAK0703098.1 hypothetical protein B0T26DRAFT_680840 [Lasiosphaeria miniovina]